MFSVADLAWCGVVTCGLCLWGLSDVLTISLKWCLHSLELAFHGSMEHHRNNHTLISILTWLTCQVNELFWDELTCTILNKFRKKMNTLNRTLLKGNTFAINLLQQNSWYVLLVMIIYKFITINKTILFFSYLIKAFCDLIVTTLLLIVVTLAFPWLTEIRNQKKKSWV